MERVVKPAPAWVTVFDDDPAPKIRSLALVVVTDPLFMALEDPAAELLTSNGASLSMPEYSWIYMIPQEVMALLNVAVTVFAPPLMFRA